MEIVRFEDLQLDERILRAMMDMGFETASPIQTQTIPTQLKGMDIIGQAQTGTDKTAAFGIPLFQKIGPKREKPQAIALRSTRELAIQITEEVYKLAKYAHRVKVVPIYGGQDIMKRIRSLKNGTQIVVGTPGHVMDHTRRKTIKCDGMYTIIIDKANEVPSMEFLEDVETVLSQLPKERQVVMFSTTMSLTTQDIAKEFQRNPMIVKTVEKELAVPKVIRYYHGAKPKTRLEVMCRLLDLCAPKLPVALCNTKKQVDELVQEPQECGHFAEGLHGDLKQTQRDRVIDSSRNGETEILIATDVAARGIDTGDVEAVLSYDILQDGEYYVHRIDRTGRAGHEGVAFSFMVGKEIYELRDAQKCCKTRIMPQPILSLDDTTAIKVDRILEQAANIVNDNDLNEVVNLIEKRLLEEDYTSMNLAAALLEMSTGEDNEDITESGRTTRPLGDLGNYGYGGRDGGHGNRSGGRRDSSRRDSGCDNGRSDMAQLFINIRKNQDVRPGDTLGTIIGEPDMSGKMVRSISIHDKYIFAEVPRENADAILDVTKSVRIKGKGVHMEKVSDRGR